MPLTKGSGQYIFFRRKQNERSLFLECFRRNADNQRKGTIHIIVGGKEMRLQENIKNRKMMHHDDTAGHGHNHEHDGCCCGHEHDHEHHHDHDDCCGHDHEHDHHHDHDGCCCGHEYGHSHGHKELFI